MASKDQLGRPKSYNGSSSLKNDQLKILLIADPDIPTPPKYYGGIERIVNMLAREYDRLGHEVTLLAGPESSGPERTFIYGTNGSFKTKQQRAREILEVWKFLIGHHHKFDVVHNFGRLIYFLPVLNQSVRKVMSYQRPISKRNIQIATRLPHKNLYFTALSQSCAATGNVRGVWKVIYNGVPVERFTFQPEVSEDAPLLFLGRLDKVKGAHTAIHIAKKTGHRLILAGNKPDLAHEIEYYQTEIEPHIDGKQIIYVGPVDDIQKNDYLGKAKALLFPIEWEEPFGIVMAESLACGTPVIAFKRGAVPEVITQGETGYICHDISEMISGVQNITKISRRQCRNRCEEMFSGLAIAKQYLGFFSS